MKTILAKSSLWLLAFGMSVVSTGAANRIHVIATLPELAEFAREIGGKSVDVESLATGVEDPHGVPMKPSFVTKLNRADFVIVLGLDLEHAFMPGLLDASKNPKILAGKSGYIDCSRDITPLEVPKTLSRAEGELHPSGNPHYNLDPVSMRKAFQTIYEAFVKNFPDHEAEFKTGRDAYLARLDKKMAEWQELAKPLQGLKFVSYHNEFPYFCERFGTKQMGTMELRHGVDPTAGHIKELIEMMKSEHVKVVVREPQFSERVPNQIAAQTGSKVAKIPIMSGGPQAKTYFEFIENTLRTLLDASK